MTPLSPHLLSETPSYSDPLYEEALPPALGSPSSEELVSLYRDPLLDHLTRRVSLLFFTLIVAFKTELVFKVGEVEEGPVRPLLSHDGEELTLRSPLFATLLPHLKAQRRDGAWVPYLPHSDFARQQSASVELPEEARYADLLLRESPLVSKTLALVQQASLGKVSPKEGTLAFCNLFLAQVKVEREGCKLRGARRVLELYEKEGKKLFQQLKKGEFFYEWLGLSRPDPKASSEERSQLRRSRYVEIQREQFEMSWVVSGLEDLKKRAFQGERAPLQDGAFRSFLGNELPFGSDRRRVRRLYNFPGEQLFLAHYSEEDWARYTRRCRKLWEVRQPVIEEATHYLRAFYGSGRGARTLPPLPE